MPHASAFLSLSRIAKTLLSRLQRWLNSPSLPYPAFEALEPRLQLVGPATSGLEFLVNTYTTSGQIGAQITALHNDNFVLVWASNQQDGSEYGIYGQIYDDNGIKVGSEFLVNASYTTGNQRSPNVITLSDGNFLVSWQSVGQPAAGDQGLYAQIYTPAGVAVGAPALLNSKTVTIDIAASADGGFIAAWSATGSGGNYDVFAQIYDNSASPTTGVFLANTYTLDAQEYPSVTSTTEGLYVLTWSSEGQDGNNTGIYAQRFLPDGSKWGGEFAVNTYTTGSQTAPSIAPTDSGFIVTWTSDGQDGSGTGIYGQYFKIYENKLGPEFRINDSTVGNQLTPTVINYAQSIMHVFWATDYSSIHARRISINNISGEVFYSTEFQVNTNPGSMSFPTAAYNTFGGMFTAWSSTGIDSSTGISAQLYEVFAPVATSVASPASPTSTAVGSIQVTFSEPMMTDSFDWTFLILTRDGGGNLIDSSTTLTMTLVAGTTYSISGFSALTAAPGAYTLTNRENYFYDLNDNLLDNTFTASWVMIDPAPSTPALAPASTYSGNIANTTKPRFTGTAAPNASVEFFVDDVLNNVYTADASGNYSFETYALTQGAHTIKARTTTTVGGIDYFTESTSYAFTVNSGLFTYLTNPGARSAPVTALSLNVGAPVNLATLTAADILLTRNGVPVDLAGLTIALGGAGYAPNALRLSLPAALTSAAGDYVLTVFGDDVSSAAGQQWLNDISVSWTNAPSFTRITQPATPSTTPVTTLIVNPSSSVDLTSITSVDFTFTRNSIPVDISGAGITVSLAGAGYAPNAVKLTFPHALTSVPGDYQFTLNGSGVNSALGEAFLGSVTANWTLQAYIAPFSGPFSFTRNSPFTSTILNFNAPVDLASLSDADFVLTRGGVNQTVSGLTFSAAGPGYAANAVKLTLPTALTAPNGDYSLTLLGAGILTTSGVSFANDRSLEWTNQALFTHLSQFTSPRATPVTTFTLNPQVAIDLSSLTLDDIGLVFDGESVTLLPSDITIALAGAGYAPNAIKITLAASLTTAPGEYTFHVFASGINSIYGPAFVNSVFSTWTKS